MWAIEKLFKALNRIYLREEDPPQDYRLLPIIPTVNDLYEEKPFIRPAKIQEAYESVEHYLDVQFRLLREDFLAPLRRGLNEYLISGSYRNDDVRVYKNVKFYSPVHVSRKKNVGVELNFGVLNKVDWRNSQRFMRGGLLLLSKNNFEDVIFATVVESEESQLARGFVLIEPVDGTFISPKMFKTEYVMLEPKIFFLPYKAVLSAMKQINEINFPMKDYFVFASTSTKLPPYFRGINLFERQENTVMQQKNLLNESQFNAYKHALTEEFALIQGPPGTGKTFTSLQIIKTLLAIQKLWKKHGPILVVCYTNHALDQFLEGILDYTESIVRVGEGSKSEKLLKYTLKEKRSSSKDKKTGYSSMKTARAKVLKSMDYVKEQLTSVNKIINILKNPNFIVPLHILNEYCYISESSQLQTNEDLLAWLCEDFKATFFNFMNDRWIQESEDNPDYQQPIYPLYILNSYIDQIKTMKNELSLDTFEQYHPNFMIKQRQMVNSKRFEKILIQIGSFIQEQLDYHPLLQKPCQKPFKSSDNLRWKLYWEWVKESHDTALNELTVIKEKYDELFEKFKKLCQMIDLEILRNHLIVGLTTTGAAQNQTMLNALGAPILIVEEAAEIVESHVLCSLTKNCQHVILIGDHKQLRPKVSDYELGRDFNLNISLFERFVRIRGECIQLRLQHRMRSEISKLITPAIYKILHDHESVEKYPKIKGLEKNLFFLNHQNYETNHPELKDTYVNNHEIDFLMAFANHLIKQGYEQDEITILCTYSGQLFEMKKKQNKFNHLKDINIQTVDNYQGEENKIILLSLVRNNGEGRIGFLKEENRVCVALSRAKEGLYIMGNMDDLVIKNHIWPKLKKVLESQRSIGENIDLRCQIHTDQVMKVKAAKDFEQCPGGGCSKMCNSLLKCGHTCADYCHILDVQHKEYKCKKPCTKFCVKNHACPWKCWQKCTCTVPVDYELKCGHVVKKPCFANENTFSCYIKVTAILPDCKHEIEKPCAQSIENSKCSYPCETALSCGHSCKLKCHVKDDPNHINYQCKQACTKTYLDCEKNHLCKKKCYEKCGRCPIQVDKERSCGHFYKNIDCSVNIEKKFCEKPCKRELNCGHQCKLKCSKVCGSCQEEVKKTISSCGHELTMRCCDDPSSIECNQNCLKTLPCGHRCAAKCKVRCESTLCLVKKKLDQPALCGHIFSVPCHLHKGDLQSPNLLLNCGNPCPDYLKCGHKCEGTCGQCFQGRIHIPCKKTCSIIFPCGHKCDRFCGEACNSCQRTCQYQCNHGRRCSNKKCLLPCKVSCTRKCDWGCEHRSCTRKCDEICNVEPCMEICKKKLKCRHPCLGFCGEPCPPLCSICNKVELSEIYPNFEDFPDFRLIFLEDCKHSVRNSDLISLIDTGDKIKIEFKCCPRCGVTITRCKRFIVQSRVFPRDIFEVKKKMYRCEENKDNRHQKIECKQKEFFHQLMKNRFYSEEEYPDVKIFLQELKSRISLKMKYEQQFWGDREYNFINIYFDSIKIIFNIMLKINFENTFQLRIVKNQLLMIAKAIQNSKSITKQNISEVKQEMKRLDLMIYVYNECKNPDNKEKYNLILEKLNGCKKFDEELKEKFAGITSLRSTVALLDHLDSNVDWSKETFYKNGLKGIITVEKIV